MIGLNENYHPRRVVILIKPENLSQILVRMRSAASLTPPPPSRASGFRVEGLGCGALGVGFRVWGLGSRGCGMFRIHVACFVYTVYGLWFMVYGLWVMVCGMVYELWFIIHGF